MHGFHTFAAAVAVLLDLADNPPMFEVTKGVRDPEHAARMFDIFAAEQFPFKGPEVARAWTDAQPAEVFEVTAYEAEGRTFWAGTITQFHGRFFVGYSA